MSARPDEEHHELLLCAGRNVDNEARVVPARFPSAATVCEDVVGFYRRFKENNVKRFDMILSHGNAVGIYVFDPDGQPYRNLLRASSGLKAKQPYGELIDLDKAACGIAAAYRGSTSPSTALPGLSGGRTAERDRNRRSNASSSSTSRQTGGFSLYGARRLPPRVCG